MLLSPVRKFYQVFFRSEHSLDLKAITKKNLPYSIAWICIFVWLYAYFLPMGGFKFESDLYNDKVGDRAIFYYVWLLFGGLIPMFFSGRQFVPKAFYSLILAFICFFTLRFTGAGLLSRGLMIVASACIGHIFAASLYVFFMILNNSEKFYAMTLAVLFPKILMMIKPSMHRINLAVDPPSLIILAIIVILGVCTRYFLKQPDGIPQLSSPRVPAGAYALMPVVFVVVAINDVIAPAALNQTAAMPQQDIESFYFCGIALGLAIVILLQKRFAINICNMLNISFAFLAIGFVIHIISLQSFVFELIAAFCFGISYAIGFVNIYYLAGFMAKKFQSMTFYRVGIGLSAIYYFLSFLVLDLLRNTQVITPLFMAFASICIVIIFFLLTPFFVKILYTGEWIDDAYRQDVTQCSRLEAKLKDYNLTPSEVEVCRLLLNGCTLRQISGIQAKAYATINSHYTSIYRKLGINSRTELLLLLREYRD